MPQCTPCVQVASARNLPKIDAFGTIDPFVRLTFCGETRETKVGTNNARTHARTHARARARTHTHAHMHERTQCTHTSTHARTHAPSAAGTFSHPPGPPPPCARRLAQGPLNGLREGRGSPARGGTGSGRARVMSTRTAPGRAGRTCRRGSTRAPAGRLPPCTRAPPKVMIPKPPQRVAIGGTRRDHCSGPQRA